MVQAVDASEPKIIWVTKGKHNIYSTDIFSPSCHNMTCVNGVLKIRIAESWFDCLQPGQVIQVTGYTGSYICPANLT
jgi:hypothetical protein